MLHWDVVLIASWLSNIRLRKCITECLIMSAWGLWYGKVVFFFFLPWLIRNKITCALCWGRHRLAWTWGPLLYPDLVLGRKAKLLKCVYLGVKYVQEINGQIIIGVSDITIITRDIPKEQKRSVITGYWFYILTFVRRHTTERRKTGDITSDKTQCSA